jgi:hypothetical protein
MSSLNSSYVDVCADNRQVLAREQAVEKKEAELAAREAALNAKETSAPAPAEPEAPAAAESEPAAEAEKAAEPEPEAAAESVVSLIHSFLPFPGSGFREKGAVREN